MNKYEKWYSQIVERAQNRIFNEYTELHHIVPRSLGGTNNIDNLVKLSAREHFICHWLLTKMFTGTAKSKMINAMYIMRAESSHQKRYQSKITSRVYENLRKDYSKYISDMNKGRVQPLDEKVKQVKAQTGRKRAPFSNEWRAKLSAASAGTNNSRYGVVVTDETRRKIGNKIRGRKQTQEEKAKRSAANIGKKREKIHCTHCDQMVAVNGYARWHGDSCKNR